MSDIVAALNAAPQVITTLGVGGGAGYTLARIVGPSINAIGTVLGEATEYRVRNWLSITEKAERRRQELPEEEREDEDAEVHPRVAQAVLEQGSWVDDPLLQEYLAGLLISARSSGSPSDSAAYYARIIAGLTAEQCHLHYAMVTAYEGYWPDPQIECPFPFAKRDEYRKHAVKVDIAEVENLFPSFDHIAAGLHREGLVADSGRPRDKSTTTGMSATQTSIVPTPLAFTIYKHALAPNPRALHDRALMLPRQVLETAHLGPGRDHLKLVRPDPEPPRFRTATIGEV